MERVRKFYLGQKSKQARNEILGLRVIVMDSRRPWRMICAPVAKPPNAHLAILLEVNPGPVRNSVHLAWVLFIHILHVLSQSQE